MERYAIYIWLLVFAGLATGLTPYLGDLLLAQNYGVNRIPSFELAKFKAYASSIGFVENVVSAIWLMKVANRNNSLRLVWSLFGLVYGLWAIAIYYLIAIYEQLTSGDSAVANAQVARAQVLNQVPKDE